MSGGALEPEHRQAGEDLALVGDRGGQHDVVRRDAVRGDHQEAIAQVVHLAHLAAAVKCQPGEFGGGFRHSSDANSGRLGSCRRGEVLGLPAPDALAPARAVAAVHVGGVPPRPAVDVVALSTTEGVDAVVAGAGQHPVVARVRADLVVPGPAVDRVVAPAARDAVVPGLARQAVVAGLAEDRVVVRRRRRCGRSPLRPGRGRPTARPRPRIRAARRRPALRAACRCPWCRRACRCRRRRSSARRGWGHPRRARRQGSRPRSRGTASRAGRGDRHRRRRIPGRSRRGSRRARPTGSTALMTSSPGPACTSSRAVPPTRKSLPAPPYRTSSALFPSTRSLPSPPYRRSPAGPESSTSSPPSPWSDRGRSRRRARRSPLRRRGCRRRCSPSSASLPSPPERWSPAVPPSTLSSPRSPQMRSRASSPSSASFAGAAVDDVAPGAAAHDVLAVTRIDPVRRPAAVDAVVAVGAPQRVGAAGAEDRAAGISRQPAPGPRAAAAAPRSIAADARRRPPMRRRAARSASCRYALRPCTIDVLPDVLPSRLPACIAVTRAAVTDASICEHVVRCSPRTGRSALQDVLHYLDRHRHGRAERRQLVFQRIGRSVLRTSKLCLPSSPPHRWSWRHRRRPTWPHTVEPGETLWSIAAASNLTTRTLAAANGLPDDAQVVIGSTIQIPSVQEGAAALVATGRVAAPSAAPVVAPAPEPAAPEPAGAYTVQPGTPWRASPRAAA